MKYFTLIPAPAVSRVFAPILVASLVFATVPLVPAPAFAQEAQAEQEFSLWDWGMSWFGGTLPQDLAPALGDLQALADKFGPAVAPALEKLTSLADDMTNYELPEMLENGDILIRRKPEAPTVAPPADAADGAASEPAVDL